MPKLKLLLPILLFLVFSACSKKPANEVALIQKNFSEEIALQQNLEFTLSHDLVPPDMIGNWDSSDYLSINPKVDGRFRWSAANTLVFSPNHSFAPSTDYTIKFTDKILDKAEEKGLYLGKEIEEKLNFHTPYLRAENISAFWARQEGSQQVRINVTLHFNYEVDPATVLQNLSFFLDDMEVKGTLESKAKTSDIILLVDPGTKGEEDVMLRVKLKKGILIAESKKGNVEDQELATVLSSRLRLDITEIDAQYDNNEGVITILTSQELLNSSLEGVFTLSPALSTTQTLLPNGFEIRGAFDLNQIYALTILPKLEGVLGGKMKEKIEKNLSFGELKPSIAFVNQKALYLSSAGAKNIAVNIVNVPKIKVRIYKIYQNNILAYLRHNSYSDWEYDYDLDEYVRQNMEYREDYDGQFSDMIYEKEIETGALPMVNGIRALNLDIPKENLDYKGIYYVMISSNDTRYLNASKLVSISDVGIVAKTMKDKVMVMAHSILDTKALSNVEVSLISTNNQVMVQGRTGSDGVLVFEDLEKRAPGFSTAMITVQTDKDFNFVPFSTTSVETSRFDVGGKYEHHSGFDAWTYGERNLYRPGETIHLNTIVRTNDWKSVGSVPLKWKLIMPNGRELKTEKVKTNKEGSVESVIELPSSALTGSYSYEVYNGNDVLLNSYSIQIEEFMPDRIRIKGKLNKDYYQPGDTLSYAAFAENFFGPPAANRNYEFVMQFNRENYTSKNYPRFSFYNSDETNYQTITREGKTGTDGTFKESHVLSTSMEGTGIVRIKAFATVFDESGRPVHSQLNSKVLTQDVFYGIRMNDYYVSTNSPMNIELVAVDQKDNFKKGAKAIVEVYRYEWQNVIENSNNYYRYRSKKVEKIAMTRNITFGSSPYSFSFNPMVSGEYEVRVRKAGATDYVSYYFYAYGWGRTENSSFEVNSEGQIEMECDKPQYEVGDRVKVLMKTPFAGKILLTIERNDVLENKVVETDKKSAEFTFTVSDAHVPNIYISATLIRPMDGSSMPLTVAHGYLPVMVEKKASRLPVEIVAVESSRSRTKQRITIRSKPESDIEVTLAAVDEGILQLKHYKTPNPHEHFYQKRALEVSSYDIYAMLFPELNSKKSSGGDMQKEFEEGGEKRANPLANQRVKLLSKWSGILHTNSKGEAYYDLDIPQFNGEIRLMAVVYKGSSFGAGSKTMKVADPLVINTALPRFLSPGDIVALPVNLANTTKTAAQAKIVIKVEGELEIEGSTSGSIAVPANAEALGSFKIKAKQSIGSGKITVLVQGLGESFKEELDITIRPAVPLTRHNSSSMLEVGKHTVNLVRFDGLIPSSRQVDVVVSRSPLIQFMDEFSYLVGYPHGCVEQTTSKAFPQLYLADFLKSHKSYFKGATEGEWDPSYNVRQAIIKLSSMQQYNGALSYWPGAYEESYWGTVYATHFLLEAKKAGYEVNQQVIDRCISYLSYKNAQKLSENAWYMVNGQWVTRVIADRSQIYGLYVLAVAGKPNKSLMNHFKANSDLLSTDSKYLLGAAFALTGDLATYKKLAPTSYPSESTRAELDGNFASDMRNLAISVNTLIDVDPTNKQIPSLTRLLSSQLKSRYYHNTQELVFTLLALGKMNRSLGNGEVNAIIKSDGKIIGRFDGKSDLKIRRKDLTTGNLEIEVNGKGNVYVFAEVSGIDAKGTFDEKDNFLHVRRTFYNRFGQALNTTTFKQNELIVVRVAISSLNGSRIENVAITDMLPAGFEIENPRLNDLPDMDWIKNMHSPDYYDFRDDRVNLYTDVSGDTKYFYFQVRAVSRGTFRMGPIGADAMYNGEYHSYHGGGTVIVE